MPLIRSARPWIRSSNWADLSARLDPSRPEGRRFALRRLLGVAAVTIPPYWALSMSGFAAEGEGRELELALLGLFSLAVTARGPTLRPLGFAALCAIPVLPLLFTIVLLVRGWMR